MRGRPRRQAAWMLGALLALGACTPAPSARLTLTTPAPQAARLELRLPDALPGSRRLLATTGQGMRVTVDGPDMTAPVTATALPGADRVTVEAVPPGGMRVVTLVDLDAAGATVYAVMALKAGDNTLSLSPAGSVAGEVASRLLATDRSAATQVLAKVTPAALQGAIAGMITDLAPSHPAMLDAARLATAIADAGGTLPAAWSGFLREPARVIVRPRHPAAGVTYRAWLTDPASPTASLSGSAAAPIAPVAPGDWTLVVEADSPGVPVQKLPVRLASGQTLEVTVDLAGSRDAAALPIRFAPAGGAVFGTGTSATLLTFGGTSYNPATGPQYFTGLVSYHPTTGWGSAGSLGGPVLQPAVAVHNGKLYWFGGHDGNAPVGAGGVFTPGSPGTVATTAPLPSGLKLVGASAGGVGELIYVAGGLNGETAYDRVLMYDPLGNAWGTHALPPDLPAQQAMASAVVNGTWYLFGGLANALQYSDGDMVAMPAPQSGVRAFSPASPASWRVKRAMPTPRAQAGTVVVNGKIWVIGGSGILGRPSRAVEVYDPASDTWEVKPPLRQGRAYPAVGLIGGKIVVAGGLDGDDPFDSLALDTAEEITP